MALVDLILDRVPNSPISISLCFQLLTQVLDLCS